MKYLQNFLYVLFTNYMTRMGFMIGATDTLLTMSMITNESLMILENETVFASAVNRKYDDSFGIDGAKIGDTLNVRRPPRFVGTSGPNLNVEDYNQTSIPVVVGNPGLSGGTNNPYGDQFHVDVSFTTKDLKLSLGAFSDNVIKPAVAAVANRIDYIGLLMAKNSTANIVGVAGTPPTSLLTYLTAGAYLTAEGAPLRGGRSVVIEQFTGATIVDALKGLFNPNEKISEQYRTGLMGKDSAGMDWLTDQNVNSHTFGSWATTPGTLTIDTTGAFTGSIASGWASSSTVTMTASQTLTLNAGDIVTFAGVYPVNPQNRQIYGSKLKNFVVKTTVSDAGTTASLVVSPAIITGGQFQNCSVSSTSATAAVTPFNIAGTTATAVSSPQNILMHKNAFTLAMADLPLPRGVEYAGRASSKEGGMSIRVVTQYTINNDQMPTRFDTLFGWAPLYQELATRVAA